MVTAAKLQRQAQIAAPHTRWELAHTRWRRRRSEACDGFATRETFGRTVRRNAAAQAGAQVGLRCKCAARPARASSLSHHVRWTASAPWALRTWSTTARATDLPRPCACPGAGGRCGDRSGVGWLGHGAAAFAPPQRRDGMRGRPSTRQTHPPQAKAISLHDVAPGFAYPQGDADSLAKSRASGKPFTLPLPLPGVKPGWRIAPRWRRTWLDPAAG